MNFRNFFLIITCFLSSLNYAADNLYTNSVILPSNYNMSSAADPFAFKDANGIYYCYVTGKGFPAFISRDLVKWAKSSSNPFPSSGYKWATANFWAPEVVKVGNIYYMHYTGKGADNIMSIGLAQSTSALGPFTDVSDKPFYSMKNKSIIDSHIFFDDDGKAYLFFAKDMSTNYVPGSTTKKRSEIWGIEIKPDLTDTIGPAKQLFYPSQNWENPNNNDAWNEAPTMIKRNGLYYLMYSANCYCGNYSVGYAISRSPLGPWTKYSGNPILKGVTDYVSGTGHNSVVMSPDGTEMICVYHSHIDLVVKGGNRKINIDRMGFTDAGVMYVDGPTYTPQSYPSAMVSAVDNVNAEKNKLQIIYHSSKKQISFNTPLNSTKVSLYNVNGVLVYSKPLSAEEGLVEVPVENLGLGIYMVRVENRFSPSINGMFVKRTN